MENTIKILNEYGILGLFCALLILVVRTFYVQISKQNESNTKKLEQTEKELKEFIINNNRILTEILKEVSSSLLIFSKTYKTVCPKHKKISKTKNQNALIN